MMQHILEILPEEFSEYLKKRSIKKYRKQQIYNWLYSQMELDFDRMSSLSKEIRTSLAEDFSNFLPTVKKEMLSQDGTRKFLLSLKDDSNIEMVLIPNKLKNTLCISSQVGCKRKCEFCATAKLGFKRNLECYEIVSQVYLAKKILDDKKLTNIVFMGMGEPLDNLQNVIKATEILQNELCFNLSPRRITISTAGVIPQIKVLADSDLKVKLAVSLNSAIQSKREILMPITKIYPLDELKKTLQYFRRKTPYRITFEYVMIKDINTAKEDGKALLKYIGDISCKLNLIKWNAVSELPYEAPSEEEVKEFTGYLQGLSSMITFRKSRGTDIAAACGQLAGKLKST